MKHVILTCKHHQHLRWSCKEIAYTKGYGYNGARNIFFKGELPLESVYDDKSGCSFTIGNERECSCRPEDMILAPENALLQ